MSSQNWGTLILFHPFYLFYEPGTIGRAPIITVLMSCINTRRPTPSPPHPAYLNIIVLASLLMVVPVSFFTSVFGHPVSAAPLMIKLQCLNAYRQWNLTRSYSRSYCCGQTHPSSYTNPANPPYPWSLLGLRRLVKSYFTVLAIWPTVSSSSDRPYDHRDQSFGQAQL